MAMTTTRPALTAITAFETQLDAYQRIARLSLDSFEPNVRRAFETDSLLFPLADPFAWTSGPIAATWQAAQSLPADAMFSRANLPEHPVWWYFEDPLPVRSLWETDRGVRALLIGQRPDTPDDLSINLWCDPDDEFRVDGWQLMPTSAFVWKVDSTLEEMLARVRQHHEGLYGKGGRYHRPSSCAVVPDAVTDNRIPQGVSEIECPCCGEKHSAHLLGEEAFAKSAEQLGRFILAGFNWIQDDSLVSTVEHIERHRRKEAERTYRQRPTLTMVHLRRYASAPADAAPPADAAKAAAGPARGFHVQWQVDGYWRNQRVGPGLSQTRLTWVSPHLKGPEDKPFRPKQKIFVVDR